MLTLTSGRMTARLLALALVAAGPLQIAVAQSRSLRGTVTDRTGEPLKGAIVNVKNTLSLHVRSYVTQADGQYRFYGLHPDIDYEVRAKYRGQAGKTKTLHWYDSRRETRIDLKVRVDRDAPPDTGANSKQLRKRDDRRHQ